MNEVHKVRDVFLFQYKKFEVSEETSRHQVQKEQVTVLQLLCSRPVKLVAYCGCQKLLWVQGKTG